MNAFWQSWSSAVSGPSNLISAAINVRLSTGSTVRGLRAPYQRARSLVEMEV